MDVISSNHATEPPAPSRHVYDYSVDPQSRSSGAHVVRMVGRSKRVLELGCGPGAITRVMAEQSQCRVTALEYDREAIDLVRPFCENVIQADLNAQDWPDLLEGAPLFDCVVAGDVLEHLYDPWTTLQRIVPLLNPDGYIVISLPHVGHAAVAACLFDGDFDYRDWGLLDRTHIRFFGLKNIEALFSSAGLKIVEAQYVLKHPQETEFAERWHRLPFDVRRAFQSSPHCNVYQVVVRAVPQGSAGERIALIPPPVARGPVAQLLNFAERFGPKGRKRTKKLLRLMGVR